MSSDSFQRGFLTDRPVFRDLDRKVAKFSNLSRFNFCFNGATLINRYDRHILLRRCDAGSGIKAITLGGLIFKYDLWLARGNQPDIDSDGPDAYLSHFLPLLILL